MDCVNLETARPFIENVIRRYFRNPDEIEDVVQEAWTKAYKYRASYKPEWPYKAWVHRIAVTAAVDYMRKRHRTKEVLSGDKVDTRVDDTFKNKVLAGLDVKRLYDKIPSIHVEHMCLESTFQELADEHGGSAGYRRTKFNRFRKHLIKGLHK